MIYRKNPNFKTWFFSQMICKLGMITHKTWMSIVGSPMFFLTNHLKQGIEFKLCLSVIQHFF